MKMYALITAPLPGLTSMLLLTEDFTEVCDYARNWASNPVNRGLNPQAHSMLNPDNPPRPVPEGRNLTNYKDGLILHTYETTTNPQPE